MIFLNHPRPLTPPLLIRQFLLIPGQRPLLNNTLIGGQVRFREEALDVSDAALELIDGGVLPFFSAVCLRL
jgi:hypothetical protein